MYEYKSNEIDFIETVDICRENKQKEYMYFFLQCIFENVDQFNIMSARVDTITEYQLQVLGVEKSISLLSRKEMRQKQTKTIRKCNFLRSLLL